MKNAKAIVFEKSVRNVKPKCDKMQPEGEIKTDESCTPTTYSPVPIIQLFRFADKLDNVLLAIGVLASIITGLCYPATNFAAAIILNSLACYVKNKKNLEIIMGNGTNSTGGNSSCHVNRHSQVNCSTLEKPCEYWTDNDIYLEVKYLAIVIAIVGAIDMIFGYVRVTSLNIAANNQVHRISSLYLKSVLRQDITWFDDKRTGEYVINSIDGMQKYKSCISTNLGDILVTAMSCCASYICAFIYGWKLALVALVTSALTVGSSVAAARLNAAGRNYALRARTNAGNYVEDILSALKTVVALGGENKEAERFEEQLNIHRNSCVRHAPLTSFAVSLTRLFLFINVSLTLWYGSQLLYIEFYLDNPVYDAFVLTLVLFNVVFSANNIIFTLPACLAVKEGQNAISFVYSVIDRIPPIDSFREDGLCPNSMLGTIEFSAVKFNYPSRATINVLDDISLKVNAGKTLAIVGESGCGKSTITHLIERFYDPIYGTVSIDGLDVRALNIGWLRTNIGVVGQEPVLFSTTIAENIRFGKKGATQKDIEDAAKAAFAHEFICELPKKYETVIGDRGSQLSGGQKQRIAIARAIIGNPKILLLDEATSALDYESEITVLKALKKAAIGRSTILITHRLSVIRDVDQICVMFNGKIAELGNHNELMKLGGFYWKFVERQDEIYVAQDTIDRSADIMNNITLSFKDVSDVAAGSNIIRKTSGKHAENGSFKNNSFVPDSTSQLDSDPNFTIRLLKENLPDLKYLILGIIMSILAGFSRPISVLIIGYSYNIFIENDVTILKHNAHNTVIYLAILAAYGASVVFVQYLLIEIYEQNLTKRLRLQLFRCILKQEVGWFDKQSQNVGEIYTNFLYDVSSIMSAIRTCALYLVEYLSAFAFSVVTCCLLDWRLGLVSIAFVPIFVAAYKIEGKAVVRYTKKEVASYKKTNKIAIEAISNIRTVASLHREKSIIEDYEIEKQHLKRAGIQTSNVQGIMSGLCHSLTWFAICVISYYGSFLVLQDELQFDNYVTILSMSYVLTRQFGFFMSVSSSVEKGILSTKRLYQIFDRKSEIDPHDQSGNQPSHATFKPLQLDGVHFCYPSRLEAKILQGIDLNIFRGQNVGLVGSSGCGKSTIFQLFLRMYDPQSGIVKFGDDDVKKLNIAALRANIAIVSQEPVMFDRSIMDNIAYGDNTRNVPLDEIISAARKANIHNFVSALPDGYNTRVGDKGVFISGGQKQRIAIARALVRNPKVLFLDEATSALDSENEKVVQDALEEAQVGRTSVVVSHRLSTVVNCDMIIVMHEGKVIEVGSHYELLKSQGYYSKLYNSRFHY